ncbi:MAG: methyltransferase domain-containing protein [Dehalococcoidia bacterium]|nr:methyltransferase domain-containing protein [Dehalococcoidia bacterium]
MFRGGGEGDSVTNTAAQATSLDQVVLGNPSYVWRFGQERRLDMIRRYLALEDARILDIGCGIGAYVRRLGDFRQHLPDDNLDLQRVQRGAMGGVDGLCAGVGEYLPFADNSFDGVLLNEVIEHVTNDRDTLREALRVTKPGGRVVIFAPNRFYPFETHGVYLGKRYVFGNIPLVNYLPDRLRDRLVPHARAYTRARLERISGGLPGRWVEWTVIYPGFDDVIERKPAFGKVLRDVTYTLEQTWLKRLGLSHLLVLEKKSS